MGRTAVIALIVGALAVGVLFWLRRRRDAAGVRPLGGRDVTEWLFGPEEPPQLPPAPPPVAPYGSRPPSVRDVATGAVAVGCAAYVSAHGAAAAAPLCGIAAPLVVKGGETIVRGTVSGGKAIVRGIKSLF